MATDETFEDVDWDALSEGVTIPYRELLMLVTLVAVVGVFLYDYLAINGTGATIDHVDLVVTTFTWDVSGTDYLYVPTIVFLALYGALPLYRNPRMSRYYWRRFRRNRAAVASGVFLLAVFLIGTVGTAFLPNPAVHPLLAYQPPVFVGVSSSVPIQCVGQTTGNLCYGSWAHPLGTMANGKDIALMVVYGMKVSMEVGLIAALIIVTLGTLVGTVAAYSGGLVDEVLMRYVDIQLTFPTFFLYLLLLYLFGGSLALLIVIFGVLGWGGVARLVRSEALQRNEEEYITAAKGSGATTGYIIRRHLIPNVSNTVITSATLQIPFLILAEATFAFLGLGDPSAGSWGQVISAGRGDLASAWWISTIPGVFLFCTILAFNFLGDALRDALDPRSES